jgi:uncharacterized radical SAM superfamily Fe-S cluster-containing enzyme
MTGIMLVPTIVKGINDHEIGNIMEVARKYAGTISGVVFQPVSLCGRISQEDVLKMRYTTSDLKEDLRKYSNNIIQNFYPIATIAKFTRLVNWFDAKDEYAMNSHSDCGFVTIGILDKEKNWKPIEEFIDVEGVVRFSNIFYDKVRNSKEFKLFKALNIPQTNNALIDTIIKTTDTLTELSYRGSQRIIYLAQAIKYLKIKSITEVFGDIDFQKFVIDFLKLFMMPSLEHAGWFLKDQHLMISSMHFQDAYNFDTNRVTNCLVHYGMMDPDRPGKVLQIPFCAFNTYHRPIWEKKMATIKKSLNDAEKIRKEAQESVTKIEQFSELLK